MVKIRVLSSYQRPRPVGRLRDERARTIEYLRPEAELPNRVSKFLGRQVELGNLQLWLICKLWTALLAE